jgi:hypothetical protein
VAAVRGEREATSRNAPPLSLQAPSNQWVPNGAARPQGHLRRLQDRREPIRRAAELPSPKQLLHWSEITRNGGSADQLEAGRDPLDVCQRRVLDLGGVPLQPSHARPVVPPAILPEHEAERERILKVNAPSNPPRPAARPPSRRFGLLAEARRTGEAATSSNTCSR